MKNIQPAITLISANDVDTQSVKFGFPTSDIVLSCHGEGNRIWTVDSGSGRGSRTTIFKGLRIVEDAKGRFVLEIANAAQFMEILLEDHVPLYSDSTTAPGHGRGGGSLATPMYPDEEDRGLKQMLRELKITISIPLANKAGNSKAIWFVSHRQVLWHRAFSNSSKSMISLNVSTGSVQQFAVVLGVAACLGCDSTTAHSMKELSNEGSYSSSWEM